MLENCKSEEFQGQQLFSGLEKEYLPFKMTLVSMDAKDLTFENIAKSLWRLTKYNSMEEKSSEAMSGNVMTTKSGNFPNDNCKNGNAPKIVCWHCHKAGYTRTMKPYAYVRRLLNSEQNSWHIQ
jgi:hypothetical protein